MGFKKTSGILPITQLLREEGEQILEHKEGKE